MGILNITPDSFYDGGKYITQDIIHKKVVEYQKNGMDILDIGAYSSRPGAQEVSIEREKSRLLPVLKYIKSHFPELIISVDTFRSEVAEKSIELGADIINDISAGEIDAKIHDVVCEANVPYIAMHMQGNPQNMQNNPSYDDILKEMILYFSEIREKLFKKGLHDLILDPGFGFGKTLKHNYEILKNMELLKSLECPILAGISRKSMLYKPLGIKPQQALPATSAAHVLALQNGANILRVHDVEEARQVIQIMDLYEGA